METIAKKRYVEIDTLKGFAIFMVVLGHAIIYFPVNLHANLYCKWIFDFVSSVHMCLFFTVSGFCFSYKNGFKDFFIKKIKRLVIPYFIFNIIDVFPRYLLPSLVNRPKSIIESAGDILLHGGEYWFLYVLFIMFMVFIPMHLLQKNRLAVQIIIEVVLLALSIIHFKVGFLRIGDLLYYLFFFNTGYLIKTYRSDIFDFKFKSKALTVLVPLLLLAVWISVVIFAIKYVPAALTAILGIVTLYFVTKFNWFNFSFKRFGPYSLVLYLFNGFLLVASRTLICKITSNPALIIGFNMAVDFFISYLFIKYVWTRFKPLRFISGQQ